MWLLDETERSHMQVQVDTVVQLAHLRLLLIISPALPYTVKHIKSWKGLEHRDSATQHSIDPHQKAPQWETSIGRVGTLATWFREAPGGKLQDANLPARTSMYRNPWMCLFGIILIGTCKETCCILTVDLGSGAGHLQSGTHKSRQRKFHILL